MSTVLKCFDAMNEAGNKTAQLCSLLEHCYGGNAEAFEDIDPGHRDNLMWLAANLAQEIEALIYSKPVA